ncbi:MAG TPA: hypothetical protein PKY82_24065, partial [Pyrinomonadaceae bacterium]|nr:hypothetical protein [Pyrinomonadaceae bacterium]
MKKLIFLSIYLIIISQIAFSQNGDWQQKPGAATDIAVSANGSVWIIGTDRQTGGYGIYQWRNN